jgi:hypothetical protein
MQSRDAAHTASKLLRCSHRMRHCTLTARTHTHSASQHRAMKAQRTHTPPRSADATRTKSQVGVLVHKGDVIKCVVLCAALRVAKVCAHEGTNGAWFSTASGCAADLSAALLRQHQGTHPPLLAATAIPAPRSAACCPRRRRQLLPLQPTLAQWLCQPAQPSPMHARRCYLVLLHKRRRRRRCLTPQPQRRSGAASPLSPRRLRQPCGTDNAQHTCAGVQQQQQQRLSGRAWRTAKYALSHRSTRGQPQDALRVCRAASFSTAHARTTPARSTNSQMYNLLASTSCVTTAAPCTHTSKSRVRFHQICHDHCQRQSALQLCEHAANT